MNVSKTLFLRLLGVAYAGLAVGYVIGIRQTLRGQPAPATVGAGIVSNMASTLLLLAITVRVIAFGGGSLFS